VKTKVQLFQEDAARNQMREVTRPEKTEKNDKTEKAAKP
jgi:hypothetical protein